MVLPILILHIPYTFTQSLYSALRHHTVTIWISIWTKKAFYFVSRRWESINTIKCSSFYVFSRHILSRFPIFSDAIDELPTFFREIFEIIFQIANFPRRQVSTVFVNVSQTFQMPIICCTPRGVRMPRIIHLVRVFQTFQMTILCRMIHGSSMPVTTVLVRVHEKE